MIEIKQGGKKESQQLEQLPEKKTENKRREEKEKTASCQPKNFRQIGSPSGRQKVYFEDYVYTYLHPLFESPEETRVGILLGRVKKENDCHYIFVSGAMELPDIEFAGNTPIFLDKVREEICELIKQHFRGQYLVGWYLDLKGNTPKLTPELERIHRNFFAGRNKIFLLSDSLNREEKLFACENNAIWQKEGYYIYYEKNAQMQDYMISTRENNENIIQPEEVVDEALKNYRDILLQKEEKVPRRLHAAFYATSFLLLLTICVLGVNMINNYDKMKELEGAISVLSGSVSTETENKIEDETERAENHVVIETVGGNLTKNTETTMENLFADSTEKNSDKDTETVTKELFNNNGQDSEASTEDTETQGAVDEPSVQDTPDTPVTPESSEENDSEDTETVQTLTEAETIRLQGYYIVQKGENLAAISRKIYGDTSRMAEICEKNGIENSDHIYAGQKLILP